VPFAIRARRPIEHLCRACGICCNGVLFGDVALQPGDQPVQLQTWGMPLARRRGKLKFPQPCVAFAGDHCRIYAHRPRYCRDFECGLLLSANSGRLNRAVARRWIRGIHRHADRVRRLLQQLGDADEHLPLRRRFQRMARRCQSQATDATSAGLFSRLSLAMHELNLNLRDRFYPGDFV
jgi:uncharacterized protein